MQDPDSVQPSLMACCMDNSQRTGETICSANIFTMSCVSRCCNTLVSELSKSERYLLAKKQKESCEIKIWNIFTNYFWHKYMQQIQPAFFYDVIQSYMKKALPTLRFFHKFDVFFASSHRKPWPAPSSGGLWLWHSHCNRPQRETQPILGKHPM